MKKMEYAKSSYTHLEGHTKYLPKLAFSDECMFCINVVVDNQTIRSWGIERPDEASTVGMNSTGVMTSCAISKITS